MDIICKKCGTEYEFDDELIGPRGTTVRCSQCGYLFKVYRSVEEEEESFQGWFLKKVDGSIYPIDSLSILQRWIKAGKVTKDDEISRTGKKWKKLGMIPELEPFFKMAIDKAGMDANLDLSLGDTQPLNIKGTGKVVRIGKDRDLEDDEVNELTIPNKSLDSFSKDEVSSENKVITHIKPIKEKEFEIGGPKDQKLNPAWVEMADDFSLHKREPLLEDREGKKQKASVIKSPVEVAEKELIEQLERSGEKSRWKIKGIITLFLIITVLAGTIVYFILFQPEVLKKISSSIITKEEALSYKPFYLRGREYFLLDTEEGYLEADREYHRALSINPEAKEVYGGLAELYTTWAQYIRDDRDDKIYFAYFNKNIAEARGILLRDLEEIDMSFMNKMEQAKRFLDKVLKSRFESRESIRSLISYYRLSKEMEKAKSLIEEKEGAMNRDPEFLYEKALFLLDLKRNPEEVLPLLKNALSLNEKLIRVRYRLARVLLVLGKKEEAIANLERIVELNNNHKRSLILLDLITSQEKLFLAVYSMEDKRKELFESLFAGSNKLISGVDGGLHDVKENKEIIEGSPQLLSQGYSEREESVNLTSTGSTGEKKDYFWYIEKATKLQEEGKDTQARELFMKALEIRPSGAEAHTGLGYSDISRGAYASAITRFQTALKYKPDYGSAIIGLAEAYLSQGLLLPALETYQRYLKVVPNGPSANLARRQIKELEEKLKEQGHSIPLDSKSGSSGIKSGETEADSSSGVVSTVTTKEYSEGNLNVQVEEKSVKPVVTSDTPAVDSEPPGVVPTDNK